VRRADDLVDRPREAQVRRQHVDRPGSALDPNLRLSRPARLIRLRWRRRQDPSERI
jgi:hypothetical protein